MLATKLKVASALFLSSFIVWLGLILLAGKPTDNFGGMQFSNLLILGAFLGSAITASLSSMVIGIDLLEVKMKPISIAHKFKRDRSKLQARKPVPVFKKQQKEDSVGQLKKSQTSQPVLNANARSFEEEVVLPDTSLSIDEKIVIENLEQNGEGHEEDIVPVANKPSQSSTDAIHKEPTVEKEKPDEVSMKDNEVGSKDICCPECSKVFRTALVTLDYTSGNAKMVKLCPYCNSVIDSSEKNETGIAGCQHWFGYLKQKDVVGVPDECLECKRVLECMLTETYSTEAVSEIKKWMH